MWVVGPVRGSVLAVCAAGSIASCSSGTAGAPTLATVSIRLDVGAVATQVKAMTVVYVAPHAGTARTIGRVTSVSTAPQGYAELHLQIDRDQRLPNDVVAYVCTNRVKLQPELRTGPPYLVADSVIPASRTLYERRRC